MKTLFVTCSILMLSCSKELSYTKKDLVPEPLTETQQFIEFITTGNKKFRPVSFYSDIPIDYNPQDNNTALETDLNKYIIPYLKDDIYEFYKDGTFRITQNSLKHPSIGEEQFLRNYSARSVEEETVIDFVEHTYTSYQYRLAERGPDYFIIKVRSGEATLYSKYEVQ